MKGRSGRGVQRELKCEKEKLISHMQQIQLVYHLGLPCNTCGCQTIQLKQRKISCLLLAAFKK